MFEQMLGNSEFYPKTKTKSLIETMKTKILIPNSEFQIAKHLPNSPTILCGSIDRDVFRERAYLFIQNCDGKWVNTNLSAGREFCCKDGSPYKCPNSLI